MSEQLVLVYYNFRGQMQPIRNLLCYLDLPFVQVHLECFNSQRASLSSIVLELLRGLKIDRSQLPMLLHEGLTVYEPFAIMGYLCRRFNREDLLGDDNYNKVALVIAQARVQEILEIYFSRQPQSMIELFRMADQAAIASPETLAITIRSTFELVMEESGYLKELCFMLTDSKSFILEKITILDFLFLESCLYMIGVFDHLDTNEPLCPNSKHLSTMRKFKSMMREQSFYKGNQEYLESFSIISSLTSQQRSQGLRVIWRGNPKSVM